MNWFYPNLVRPLLFSLDSEVVHDRTLAALALLARSRCLLQAVAGWLDVPPLPVRCLGLDFPNPIGLAAGMDKQALAVPAWEALGFGFTELGGVTRLPQPGNPRPRMFRVVPDRALINRMGFNNPGADVLAGRIDAWRTAGLWPRHPVGINLGKSRDTPLSDAPADYAASFTRLRDRADFFVVNVSSPNTPNLRQLQDRGALADILATLRQLQPAHSPPRPILVKVAPDLSESALDEIVDVALTHGVAGLVATNTTVTRPQTTDLLRLRFYDQPGGLSGHPLARRSTEVIRHLHRQAGPRLPIVGVGGIFSAADAWEKVTAGATLLQLYSGLVYQGPGIVGQILDGLRDRLAGAPWEAAVGSG